MKVKTSELIGPALDYAVAKCEGWAINITQGVSSGRPVLNLIHPRAKECSPSTNWSQGGSIIEREWISVYQVGKDVWKADIAGQFNSGACPTPLIAAMRCLIASRLGDEVEIPEELCK